MPSIMHLSNSTSIDFIAHHEIQFQSCKRIYDELSNFHKCNLLIGANQIPTGAEIAVMVDHSCFQPNVNKINYKHLIHISHDLADWDIYKEERGKLVSYDLILVPGQKHYDKAVSELNKVFVAQIGWPKLDGIKRVDRLDNANITETMNIIYAPSFIDNMEWTKLLPMLIRTGHNIIIKNHIYYDFESGVKAPAGSEVQYRAMIDSLLRMEVFLKTNNLPNVEYVDRRSNLCELFPRGHVLITDSSSASLEFLDYGLSIETGRCGIGSSQVKPYCSLHSNLVKFLPLNELSLLLENDVRLREIVKQGLIDLPEPCNAFIFKTPGGAGLYGASIIEMFIYSWQNNWHISMGNINILERIKKLWQLSI
jgi:hypothetical protein